MVRCAIVKSMGNLQAQPAISASLIEDCQLHVHHITYRQKVRYGRKLT